MLILFNYEYKRTAISPVMSTTTIQRFVDMGYSEELAQAAVSRHGDDLHDGVHWLMMRETIGHCPKRLRVTDQEQTWIGSSIRYNGTTRTVDQYDKKHALIRAREPDDSLMWLHMSDQRIDWISIRHDSVVTKNPVASWRKQIGRFKVNLGGLSREHRRELSQLNCVNMYIRDGRPSHSDPMEIYTERLHLWRSIAHIVKTYMHTPSGKRPYGLTSHDIHAFRVELMSYFHCVCEIFNIERSHFSDVIFTEVTRDVVNLFPGEIHEDIALKLDNWLNPRAYLRNKLEQWKSKCLPLLEFECEDIQDDTATFCVVVHDMSFIRPTTYDASIHQHLQRIFGKLYGKNGPTNTIPGPMGTRFFENTLRMCRKSQGNANSPETFATPLLYYQKRCLGWMLHRETNSTPISSWGWTKHELADGFVFHTSAFGHMTLTSPNQSVRGGLIAQDVGMGKTVEMLALIASRPEVGPTLAIVPTSMLAIWESEAKKHAPSLKVLCFHGARRPRNMDILRSHDIVVTTYRICVNETQRHVPTLGAIRWGRIVLDESHELRNPNSATVRAVCRLYAPLRWCLSATPFNHCVGSIASMLAFFSLEPFNDTASTHLTNGLSASQHLMRNTNNSSTPNLMMQLITNFTLWEQKRHVRMGLEPMTFEVIKLKHSSFGLYERLRHIIGLRIAQDRQNPNVNSRTRILHYTRWLHLAATQPRLLTESAFGELPSDNRAHAEKTSVESYVDTLGNTDYDATLRNIIASVDNETCAICMGAMDRPTVTPCHHLFCYECIQMAYEHDLERKCPLCRAPAGTRGLQELTLGDTLTESSDEQTWRIIDYMGRQVSMPMAVHEEYQDNISSQKIDALFERIDSSQDKWVVFTQHYTCWKYICEYLKYASIRYTCIEGRMTPKQRAKAVSDFQEDSAVRVFVLTTKTAAVGLTLTAARHILFMEPCLDTNIRKQAIGRIRRIGQTHHVTIHTFKTQGTIECVKSRNIIGHLTGQ